MKCGWATSFRATGVMGADSPRNKAKVITKRHKPTRAGAKFQPANAERSPLKSEAHPVLSWRIPVCLEASRTMEYSPRELGSRMGIEAKTAWTLLKANHSSRQESHAF